MQGGGRQCSHHLYLQFALRRWWSRSSILMRGMKRQELTASRKFFTLEDTRNVNPVIIARENFGAIYAPWDRTPPPPHPPLQAQHIMNKPDLPLYITATSRYSWYLSWTSSRNNRCARILVTGTSSVVPRVNFERVLNGRGPNFRALRASNIVLWPPMQNPYNACAYRTSCQRSTTCTRSGILRASQAFSY